MLSGDRSHELLDAIAALPIGDTRLMEVCGTHTMSIAKSGIRNLLPKHIHLISSGFDILSKCNQCFIKL